MFPLFPRGSARLTHLAYADFAFEGHGVDGDVLVGVERKRIGDFVNSMCTGRLSGHQVIGLLNAYHYVYLVVEGVFRANPRDGMLEVWKHKAWYPYAAGKRQFMARDIWVFMNTLEVVCGIRCYHCATDTDTAAYVGALHQWWQKEYEAHRSHVQPRVEDSVRLFKHSTVRRVAAQLDGIGWDKAKALDNRYTSVEELVGATEAELREVDGIGKTLAASIYRQLHGGGRGT